jgi:hypothetical protein
MGAISSSKARIWNPSLSSHEVKGAWCCASILAHGMLLQQKENRTFTFPSQIKLETPIRKERKQTELALFQKWGGGGGTNSWMMKTKMDRL